MKRGALYSMVLLVVLFTVGPFAEAQMRRRQNPSPPPYRPTPSYSSPASSSSETYYSSSKGFENPVGSMAITGGLGFVGTLGSNYYIDDQKFGSTTPLSGLFAFGGEGEYFMREDFGLGGMFRYYSLSETVRKDVEVSYSSWFLGPLARFHFPNRWFDFYFGAGFGIGGFSGETKASSTTTKADAGTNFLPFYQIGLMAKVAPTMAAGIETTEYMTLGTTLNGWLIRDLMLKFRFSM